MGNILKQLGQNQCHSTRVKKSYFCHIFHLRQKKVAVGVGGLCDYRVSNFKIKHWCVKFPLYWNFALLKMKKYKSLLSSLDLLEHVLKKGCLTNTMKVENCKLLIIYNLSVESPLLDATNKLLQLQTDQT